MLFVTCTAWRGQPLAENLKFRPLASFSSDIRVGLFQKELPKEISVSSDSKFAVIDGISNKVIFNKNPRETVNFSLNGENVFFSDKDAKLSAKKVKLFSDCKGSNFIISTDKIKDRKYAGTLEISSAGSFLLPVNIIDENSYIHSILVNEMPSSWHKEALKAQAVVTRSYIRKNMGRHKDRGYDFCDITHCQVYKGKTLSKNAVKYAVTETNNEILQNNKKVIEALYHSTCGGNTANNEDIWINNEPIAYLRGVPCKVNKINECFCSKSPHFKWNFSINIRKLEETLKKTFKPNSEETGKLMNIIIQDVSDSGRVRKVNLIFQNQSFSITGYDFYLALGRNLGWHLLKSTCFIIKNRGNEYVFSGKGLGHGLGMCQWGAKAMAESGIQYKDILKHYFANSEITR